MTTELKAALFGLWTLACLISGWLLSDHWHKPVPVVAAAHAQQDLGGGNVLAARTLPQPDAKPVTAVPAHSQPVAMVHVHIAARNPVQDSTKVQKMHIAPDLVEKCQQFMTCPAVAVDETLVKDKTGQLDLIVKGDGVDQATLTPMVPPLVEPEHRWAAGLTYGSGRRYGVFVDRDAGPWRLGLEIDQAQGTGLEARVKVGWRF